MPATFSGAARCMVVGVDLVKDPAVLNAAYNDAAGVTAKFNLNLLRRINRELGGTFKLDGFEHHAFYNREKNRIEMHLASKKRQKVKVGASTFDFRAGETIHTENSYKYSRDSFAALARGAGWTMEQVWTDANQQFRGLRADAGLTFVHSGPALQARPGMTRLRLAKVLRAAKEAVRAQTAARSLHASSGILHHENRRFRAGQADCIWAWSRAIR